MAAVEVDNSLYEVRRYFFDPAAWSEHGHGYLAWLRPRPTPPHPRPAAEGCCAEGIFPVLSKYMDIVCFFAQDPDEADGTAHQDVGDKLPGQLFSQVTWVVRWNSYEHFEAGWAQMGGDASAATSQPARPWGPEGYLKTEQRFMRAVGQLPRRLDYSPRRAYEVRNYTFGEGWTAENAAQYCQWAADEVVAPGGGVHSARATCFFAAGEILSTFASDNVCFCLT